MNSQKLSRLIQPGMALYFCLLFAFAAVTFFFGDFYLALGEAAVGLLLLLYFKINAMRRRREISDGSGIRLTEDETRIALWSIDDPEIPEWLRKYL